MDVYGRYATSDDNETTLGHLYESKLVPVVREEIKQLMSPFGEDIEYGEAHPAPCSTWRAERSMHPHDEEEAGRFAYRVHLFEGLAHGTGDSSSYSYVNRHRKQSGRYLGYVSLRPLRYQRPFPFFYQYTAVATLAAPPFMLRPRYHLITCIAGAAEGVLPFRASPFCQPDSSFLDDKKYLRRNSLPCLHAALHAALLLKSNAFGFNPVSAQDMIAVLWNAPDNTRPMRALNREGIPMRKGLTILRSKESRGGGIEERITESMRVDTPSKNARKLVSLEAHRCLTDYVANGIPVIIEVTPQDERIRTGHAVLIIGFHLMVDPDEARWPVPDDDDPAVLHMEVRELPARFVIHDTHMGPYREVSAEKLLNSAWIEGENETPAGIRFLAVMPQGARIGIQDVRETARRQMAGQSRPFWQRYLNDFGSAHGPDEWPKTTRMVTRLLKQSQVVRRYLARDTTLGLDNSTPALDDARQAILEALESKKEWYWWCVEVRASRQMSGVQGIERTLPALVYIWPISLERKALLSGDVTAIIEYEGYHRGKLTVSANGHQRSLHYDWYCQNA